MKNKPYKTKINVKEIKLQFKRSLKSLACKLGQFWAKKLILGNRRQKLTSGMRIGWREARKQAAMVFYKLIRSMQAEAKRAYETAELKKQELKTKGFGVFDHTLDARLEEQRQRWLKNSYPKTPHYSDAWGPSPYLLNRE